MSTAARATSTKPLLKEFGGAKRDSLIPILQKAQEVHGYLSEEAIAEIGRHLKLPARALQRSTTSSVSSPRAGSISRSAGGRPAT